MLKGIKEVKRGFSGFREINTVIYDPSIITTDEMVSALNAAGTYRGLAEDYSIAGIEEASQRRTLGSTGRCWQARVILNRSRMWRGTILAKVFKTISDELLVSLT